MPKPSRFVFAFCFVVLAACGGVRTPDDPVVDGDVAGDGDVGVDGTNPPGTASVLAVDPANGALGVLADATITVTFSAAMDQASVEAGWQSIDLPAAAVAFAWNAAGDTLTVTPKAPLELAEGSDPATVVARAYTFDIATTARAELADDLANHEARNEHTQYRLEFQTPTNSNGIADEARYSRSGFSLAASYLLD